MSCVGWKLSGGSCHQFELCSVDDVDEYIWISTQTCLYFILYAQVLIPLSPDIK